MNDLAKLLLLCFSVSSYCAEPAALADLSLLQWRHRIILVNNPEQQQAVQLLFEQNNTKIKERDIVWFVFSKQQVLTNYSGTLSADFIAKTRAQFQLTPGKIMLIGKDGGVKFLLDRMDLEAIFSEIDAMPMRQQEMLH